MQARIKVHVLVPTYVEADENGKITWCTTPETTLMKELVEKQHTAEKIAEMVKIATRSQFAQGRVRILMDGSVSYAMIVKTTKLHHVLCSAGTTFEEKWDRRGHKVGRATWDRQHIHPDDLKKLNARPIDAPAKTRKK